MFKRSLLTVLMAGLFAGALLAQDSSAPSSQTPDQNAPAQRGPGYGHGERRGMDPVRRTQDLTTRLTLTSDQQTKVQAIFEAQQTSMKTLWQDSSLSQEDRRAKMMDLRKSSDDQIRGVLDSDQRQKWEEMKKEREQHWKERRRGGADHDGPPPSPNQQ